MPLNRSLSNAQYKGGDLEVRCCTRLINLLRRRMALVVSRGSTLTAALDTLSGLCAVIKRTGCGSKPLKIGKPSANLFILKTLYNNVLISRKFHQVEIK